MNNRVITTKQREQPLARMAQVQTLADVLKGHGDALGVVCAGGGPSFTRSDLQQRISYVANLLRNSGIKPGDTVSIAKANTVSLLPTTAPTTAVTSNAQIMSTCG